MEKLIETKEITIENKKFKVEYISKNEVYIVIPEEYDTNFDTNKILKELNICKEYKVNDSLPEKTYKSKAIIRKGYIILKPNK